MDRGRLSELLLECLDQLWVAVGQTPPHRDRALSEVGAGGAFPLLLQIEQRRGGMPGCTGPPGCQGGGMLGQ
ncbi:MAG: hypothetical protein ACRDST_05815 [Pseudonocardiaceae bacterium]